MTGASANKGAALPSDGFSFADFDFIHAPGGHAPMVDFHKNRWLGEVLHLARENGVYISLICHAPIALTSTNWRVDECGAPILVDNNAFLAAEVTTVGREGETGMLDQGYVHIRLGPRGWSTSSTKACAKRASP